MIYFIFGVCVGGGVQARAHMLVHFPCIHGDQKIAKELGLQMTVSLLVSPRNNLGPLQEQPMLQPC